MLLYTNYDTGNILSDKCFILGDKCSFQNTFFQFHQNEFMDESSLSFGREAMQTICYDFSLWQKGFDSAAFACFHP